MKKINDNIYNLHTSILKKHAKLSSLICNDSFYIYKNEHKIRDILKQILIELDSIQDKFFINRKDIEDSRFYLNIEYKYKDDIKNKGARWDMYKRKWYIDNDPNVIEKFKEFI